MNPSADTLAATRGAPRWRRGRGVLALAVGAALTACALAILVAVATMPMTGEDLRLLALYVGGASLTGIAIGWVLLAGLDIALRPPLAVRVLAAALIGTAVALANVWLVASLMFINTVHDLRLLVALLIAGAVVTTFFSAGAALMASRRLNTIADAIGRLAALDYSTPTTLDSRGGSEVVRLARDVDQLRVRLAEADAEREALDNDRRYLTAAISHDLRTPVATIRALVDALEDGVVHEADDVSDYHERVRRETERLARMLDDLSELAQIDAGALRLDLGDVPPADVASEVVEAMRPVADRCGVRLELHVADGLAPVRLDAGRLERALSNLLQNALEHSDAGSTVEVEVAPEPGAVLIAVTDSGRGLSAADLSRIWDRFYRAETSRRRSSLGSQGSGLGLAIVRGIVEAHGGTVAASAGANGGARFELRLPARP